MWDLVCLWNLAIVCCLLIWSSVISSQTTSDLASAESSRSFFYLKQKRIDNGNKCFGIIIQLMNVNRNLICLCFRFRYRRRKKRVSISCWHLAPSASSVSEPYYYYVVKTTVSSHSRNTLKLTHFLMKQLTEHFLNGFLSFK